MALSGMYALSSVCIGTRDNPHIAIYGFPLWRGNSGSMYLLRNLEQSALG